MQSVEVTSHARCIWRTEGILLRGRTARVPGANQRHRFGASRRCGLPWLRASEGPGEEEHGHGGEGRRRRRSCGRTEAYCPHGAGCNFGGRRRMGSTREHKKAWGMSAEEQCWMALRFSFAGLLVAQQGDPEPPCPGELTGSASWVTAWELWPGGGLVASGVKGPEAAGDEVRTVPSWYPQTHASQPRSEGGWRHSQRDGSSRSGLMPLPLRSLPVRSSSQPQAGQRAARGQALPPAVQAGLCSCCSPGRGRSCALSSAAQHLLCCVA